MARDRLAAMRAQLHGGSPTSNSYVTQASNESHRLITNHEQSEISDARNLASQPQSNGDGSFYTEISSLQNNIEIFNENVDRIGDLRSSALNNLDVTVTQQNAAELEEVVENTRVLSADLKRRIKDLERQVGTGRDVQARKNLISVVKSKFLEAIQNYRTVEQQCRTKYKQRLERGYKIVNPDASPEEIRAVVNNEQNGDIFSQALLKSNRYGESGATYREVQDRHEDIKRIERTLAELAQLFNEMSAVVEQQEEKIVAVNEQANGVSKDTEAGFQHTVEGLKSAKAARKKRLICFFITLIVLIIVAVIVGVVVKNTIDSGKNIPGNSKV